MSFFSDKHAIYVLAASGSTALIRGWRLGATLAANAAARRELAEMEKARRR